LRWLTRLLFAACVLAPAAAFAADLQVTDYSFAPLSVGTTGNVTFSITVTNNGPGAVNDAVLTINVSPLFQVNAGSLASGCSVAGSPQTITCNLASLGDGAVSVITYTAIAQTTGANDTTATISSATAADPNPANDALTITPVVFDGVDLSLTQQALDSSNAVISGPQPAGSTVKWRLTVTNNSAVATSAVTVTDTLPPSTDFTNPATTTATGWSCSQSGQAVTCTYTGAAVANGNYPTITLQGTIKATGGSISNSATVAVNSNSIVDPDDSNDSPPVSTISISPGADLQATKTMPSTILIDGNAVNITLQIKNNGPSTTTGATITDTINTTYLAFSGSPPAGCSVNGAADTVICTAGSLAGTGATATFAVPVIGVAPTPSTQTNIATVALAAGSGLTDGVSSNNTSSRTFTVVAPAAALTITKTKLSGSPLSANPAGPNSSIQSTITVKNSGPSVVKYSAATPLVITDTLLNDETFDTSANLLASASPAAFTCTRNSDTLATCTTGATSGSIAVNGTVAVALRSISGSSTNGALQNQACTNQAALQGDNVTVASTGAQICTTASIAVSTTNADLAIAKAVSDDNATWVSSGLTLTGDKTAFYIRLTATNNGPSVSNNVVVTDNLASVGFATGTVLSQQSLIDGAGNSLTDTVSFSSGKITWTIPTLAASGTSATETLVIKVTRPVTSGGPFNNVATIASTTINDPVSSNNSATASYTLNPVADMTIAATANPSASKVGLSTIYTLALHNNGPNPAANVVTTHSYDATRFAFVSAQVTTSSGGAAAGTSCALDPAPPAGTLVVHCSIPSMASGDSYQALETMLPLYPFGGVSTFPPVVSDTSTATVTSDSYDSNTANNSSNVTITVDGARYDLQITDNEPPAGGGITYDPIPTTQDLTYDLRVTNNGPSRATNVRIEHTFLTIPSGFTVVFDGFSVNDTPKVGGSLVTEIAAPNAACTGTTGTIECVISSIGANNFLDANQQVVFRVKFKATPATPLTGSTSFKGQAQIIAAEQPDTVTPKAELSSTLANNTATQTTTMLPSTDLEASKTADLSSATINQPITYTITFANNGPSPTTQVQITDTLPAGLTMIAGTLTQPVASAGSVATGTATCAGTTTIACTIVGSFPGDETSSRMTMTFKAKAAYPYAPALGVVTNTVVIAPGMISGSAISGDSVSTNNTGTVPVTLTGSSIAGTVYVDTDGNNAFTAGEGYTGGTTITLTGTDSYGNVIPTQTTTTNGSGNFIFSKLPPGTYTLVETQPASLIDGNESAGTAGGDVTASNSAHDSTAAHNTIANIPLPASTDATNYLFQEIASASISGTIYADTNNNGAKDAGENGIPVSAFASSPQLRLTGTDINGNAVNLTTNVDANGAYSFTNLAPSTSGYTVTEEVQPTGYADGLDRNGIGNVIAGSGGRAAPESIVVGAVSAGQALTNRDFGELLSATLAGSVFLDGNANAVRDAGETSGLAGAVIKLTGTDTFGNAITACQVTTDATGAFSFPDAGNAVASCHVLQGGTYVLTETPPPGFTHTGVTIGSLGGSAGAASGAGTPSVGAGVTSVSNIVIAPGGAGTAYNFGETGQGFAGYVYVDRNNNNTRDAGETGIPGVTVTLSGTTATSQNVCALITCTATTDASGNFLIADVPGSNGTGYTLTEQSQTTAPLSAYGDGQDGAGTVGGTTRGTAGNDVITGIVLATGELGSNYRFGERGSTLAGQVYVDSNNDGVMQAGEHGIAGVVITLSGTTSAGANVCTQRAALSPALTCTATTAADGSYSFIDLPSGSYTLVESQPSDYSDGKESTGTPAGTVNNAAFGSTAATNTIATIPLGAGISGANYDFGEIGVSLTGRVYLDPQRDGIDSGGTEPGIAGVTVTLMQGATVVATTTTNATGAFSFIGLSAGSYTVVETQPAGYGSSTPNSVSVSLTSGATQTVEFGETLSTIAGHVFVDSNNDGVYQVGEQPIPGVTVKLSGPANETAITDATGAFKFVDLFAGSYTLTETQPAQYSNGKDSAGTAGGSVGNDVISAIALPGGVDAINYDFGEVGQSISGIVYVDSNLNGKQDSGEPGIPGVTVTLQNPDGTTISTTTTAADGSYNFPVPGTGDYVVLETQPAGYGNAAENGSNRATVTVGTGQPPHVNFGEREGSITGVVYDDANDNNRQDTGEPPIPGVTVTLTGTDLSGHPVSRTAVTGRDGVFTFTNVAGGSYTLIETQPAQYQDGGDTPGTAGGSALPPPGDTISGISLAAAQDATGYLFGEHGPGAELSGSVWFDTNHNGARDPNEQGLPNWTVQLFLQGVQVASTTTDATGQYKFTDLPPGSGYSLLFREPTSGAAFGSARPNETGMPASDGVVSVGNPAGADFSTGQLRQLTLNPGANVQQQSLPLDPSGVVYDSVTRAVVPGATVKITGPAGFDPATQLLGGAVNASQTVGVDGFYQFLLLTGAPNGTYTITYTPPSGGSYNPITPSTRIAPCTGPYTVGPTPDPLLISSYDGAPPASAITSCTVGQNSTAYFLSFVLSAGVSANVVNNNLPLDPILQGAIVVTKTTPMRDVTRGGLVPYTITARDVLTSAIPNIAIVDQVPAGFRYRTGSATLNGKAVVPVENGRMLTFPPVNFAAGETKTIQLILTVGAGVGDGEHINEAWAVNNGSSVIVSNTAQATVRIEPDADFDCTDILGKVFDDRNGNGVEDDGEPGLPGVRVVTVAGDLITTDRQGRYHITCPAVPNEERGSNFILKLDPRTLPTGYRLTTENPSTMHLTRGKFVKMNFGAALLRVVRLDVQDAVFKGDKVGDDYLAKVDGLITTLEGQPSVLRITYIPRGEERKLVHARVAAIKALIEHKWGEKARRCRLIIETEESW
jgi:uncharacterized repeat protein (TIGR01451 family)